MPGPFPRIRFVADRGDARLRLDRVLVRRVVEVTRMSRARAQAWIAAGAVLVDDVPAPRASIRVREGAVVEIVLPDTERPRERPAAEALTLDVLHDDGRLLVVNKPAGVVVHPSYKNPRGTLLNAVLWRLRDRPGAQPGIISRLDKQTSGVMLVALSPDAHRHLQRQASAGGMRKEYLATVRGQPRPAAGEVALSLGRDPADRRRVVVAEDGTPSRTRYEVLATTGTVSLLRCELVTGRTHQIRVHLAARGWPILGDAMYGVPHGAIARQALHAWRVTLSDVNMAPLVFTAPLPDDFRQLLSHHGLDLTFAF